MGGIRFERMALGL